ncbi:MAG: methylmalonyl Co-A mutase-associated GTPase MeaB [Dehalococcoidales bacterium]|nr:methylmalonyl Co-A mutase-associated GTPase MeaB [Dehalococcoidales bacterium]
MNKGDNSSLAQLISLIENEIPEVTEIMGLVSPPASKAHVIGITGLAGAGKSTLIDKLIACYRRQGLTIGVIAIDPSSAITGGAMLGDRIRMQQHYLDKGVFIRSMATRGYYGGLCRAIDNTVRLLEASGKNIILIETTGVGQTETDIIHVADTVVVVLVPGYGDSIQMMKAGLIEIADIIVINKADLEGADKLENQIRDELAYSSKRNEQSILMVQASNDIGIEELYQEIEKHRTKPPVSK